MFHTDCAILLDITHAPETFYKSELKVVQCRFELLYLDVGRALLPIPIKFLMP